MHLGPPWVPTDRRLHEREDILAYLRALVDVMDKAKIDLALIVLLDEDWFRTGAGENLFKICRAQPWKERLYFCAMFDIFRSFETDEILECVSRAHSLGVKAVKIHPVIQRITRQDFAKILSLAKKAEELGMFLVIYSFSDNLNCYDNTGLEIISYLAARTKVPLVVAHAGGIDFSRAVFLARKFPQILIELSYFIKLNDVLNLKSLVLWAIESLGAERLVYASDHPYIEAASCKRLVLEMLESIKLDKGEISMIMGENALKLLKVND